jgi:preprotein translocase subunit SecB
METVKSGIQLKSVFLKNSSFNRNDEVGAIQQEHSEIGVKIEWEDKSPLIYTSLKVTLVTGKEIDNIKINAEVEMAGVFEIEGTLPPFSIEEFCNVNAAAIVYPYIRQHIRGLSLDAEVKPIILPVLNFYQMYEDSIRKDEN